MLRLKTGRMQQYKTQGHLHRTAIYHKTPTTTSNRSHSQETPIGASTNVTSVISEKTPISASTNVTSVMTFMKHCPCYQVYSCKTAEDFTRYLRVSESVTKKSTINMHF